VQRIFGRKTKKSLTEKKGLPQKGKVGIRGIYVCGGGGLTTLLKGEDPPNTLSKEGSLKNSEIHAHEPQGSLNKIGKRKNQGLKK